MCVYVYVRVCVYVCMCMRVSVCVFMFGVCVCLNNVNSTRCFSQMAYRPWSKMSCVSISEKTIRKPFGCLLIMCLNI